MGIEANFPDGQAHFVGSVTCEALIYNYFSSPLVTASAVASAVIGSAGSLTVLFLILRYKALQNTIATRLIFFHTLSYLIETMSTVLLPSDITWSCLAQGIIGEFSILSALFWATVMSFVLHSILTLPPSARMSYNPNKYLKYYHCYCWYVGGATATHMLTDSPCLMPAG